MVNTTTPVCTVCNQRHGGFRVRADRTFVHFGCEPAQESDLYYWWDLTARYHYWYVDGDARRLGPSTVEDTKHD